MNTRTNEGQKVDMATVRAWWAEQQRGFIEQFAKTHDFDFCPLHGFWKLGTKKGGLQVLTCPGCPSPEVVEELIRDDGGHDCCVERDGTVRGDASILEGIAPLRAGAVY